MKITHDPETGELADLSQGALVPANQPDPFFSPLEIDGEIYEPDVAEMATLPFDGSTVGLIIDFVTESAIYELTDAKTRVRRAANIRVERVDWGNLIPRSDYSHWVGQTFRILLPHQLLKNWPVDDIGRYGRVRYKGSKPTASGTQTFKEFDLVWFKRSKSS